MLIIAPRTGTYFFSFYHLLKMCNVSCEECQVCMYISFRSVLELVYRLSGASFRPSELYLGLLELYRSRYMEH